MPCLKEFENPLCLKIASSLTQDVDYLDLLSLSLGANLLGHTCIDLDQLSEDEKKSLLSKIKTLPHSLDQKAPLYFVNNCLYTHKGYLSEKVFLKELIRFAHALENTQESVFFEDKDLTHEQNFALKKATEKGMLLLTGGPGTGKTYTAKKIAAHLAKTNSFFKKSVILTAPTSKAAQHLKNSIGFLGDDIQIICKTLHKLVEYKSKKSTYLDASCIIVDESSMIEAPLFAKFFQSLGPSAKVILMGDQEQLPPVGMGSFFSDLLKLKNSFPLIHHVHLTLTQRFNDEGLKRLSKLSLASNPSEFLNYLKKDHQSIYLFDEPLLENTDKIFKRLQNFFNEDAFYSDTFDENKFYKQNKIILSTLRKGPLGVDAINLKLSLYFEEKAKNFRYFIQPIILTKSIEHLGVFNGESGFLVQDQHLNTKAIYLKNKIIQETERIEFEPSFAISVHKAQGSEYDHVLFMVPTGSENFSSEIIYTAITRVKKTISFWIDERPLISALEKTNLRMSGLLKLLKN